MTGECQFCGERGEIVAFQKFEVCPQCKQGGEQFLNDCSDFDMFEAEEAMDILSLTMEDR